MADGFVLDVGFKLSKADLYGKRLNRGGLYGLSWASSLMEKHSVAGGKTAGSIPALPAIFSYTPK